MERVDTGSSGLPFVFIAQQGSLESGEALQVDSQSNFYTKSECSPGQREHSLCANDCAQGPPTVNPGHGPAMLSAVKGPTAANV